MINILKKEDCVGCNACVQRCPKHCILMEEDEQGFLYPKVDLEKCIECHLCEKVCPVINQSEPCKPLHTYAARNKDSEIQRSSSSGGVFFALVNYVIKEKRGVVFGARFNDKWEVVHDYAETLEDAKVFKGSKYVQSRIGDNFKFVEDFLESGRTVLFSGTHCQITGLKLFLRKDYKDQLILVDVACHGVPSPMIWRNYLIYVSPNNNCSVENILDVSFRDKKNGWENYGIRIGYNKDSSIDYLFEPMLNNLYMQGFLKDLYLRPSCYSCPAKCGKSHSDITLADFWGITTSYPEYFAEGYYSLLLANSVRGHEVICALPDVTTREADYAVALSSNPAIEHSARIPKQYYAFWQRFAVEGIPAIASTVDLLRPNQVQRAYYLLRRITGKALRIVGLKR